MSNENLIQYKDLTPEERRESARKAGKASGEARRAKRDMREIARLVLDAELLDGDDLKQQLIGRGIDPTGAGAILFSQLAKACKGDTEAARFIRDTSGQKPVDGVAVGNLDGETFIHADLSKLTDAELWRRMKKIGESSDE